MMSYYEVLGLEPNATREEIKAAWIKKAALFHPDKNQGKCLDEYNEAHKAYDILCNPVTRCIYDETGQGEIRKQTADDYIIGLVTQIVSDYADSNEEFSLVGTALKTIELHRETSYQDYELARAVLQNQRARLNNAYHRSKKTSALGYNIFQREIEDQLAAIERKLLALKHARLADIGKFQEACIILSDYEDHRPQAIGLVRSKLSWRLLSVA